MTSINDLLPQIKIRIAAIKQLLNKLQSQSIYEQANFGSSSGWFRAKDEEGNILRQIHLLIQELDKLKKFFVKKYKIYYLEDVSFEQLELHVAEAKANASNTRTVKKELENAYNELTINEDLFKKALDHVRNYQKPVAITLAQRIRAQAGFELIVWRGGRGDLNDFHDEKGDDMNYVRAECNIRNPVRSISGKFDKEINSVLCANIGKSSKHNVVFYGRLPYTKLGQAIKTTNSNEQAAFIRLTIISDVRDNTGRTGSNPHINILGPVSLIQEVFEYLFVNPSKYKQFLEELLPVDQYPNSNNGIIQKMQPIKKVYFVKPDSFIESEPNLFREFKNKYDPFNVEDLHPGTYENSQGIIRKEL